MQFLVNIDVEMPAATPQEVKDDLRVRENARAVELIKAGKLRRIWRIVGQTANYGIWEADTLEELHANLGSLPMYPYFKVKVTPLIAHPATEAWNKATNNSPLPPL
jgi:muconolactone D-isomerase